MPFFIFSGGVSVSKHVYDACERCGMGGVEVPDDLVSTQVTMAVPAMVLALTACVSH